MCTEEYARETLVVWMFKLDDHFLCEFSRRYNGLIVFRVRVETGKNEVGKQKNYPLFVKKSYFAL